MVPLQKLIKKIAQAKKIGGLAIHLEAGDSFSMQACVIENKKGIIQITRSDHSLNSLQQVKEWLGEDIPLRVGIDGKGVVHKKTEGEGNEGLDGLLASALPNADPKDFWLQSYSVPEDIYLSVARNEIISQFIAEAERLKLTVLDIALGPFGLAALVPLLEIPDKGIMLSNAHYEITMHSNGIVSFEKNNQNSDWKVNIGDESIDRHMVHPYALALAEFVPGAAITKNQEGLLSANRGEWEQKVVFKSLIKTGLAVIFTLLLINFLLFSSFNSQNQNLTYQVAINQNNITELGKLKSELKEKNKFLTTIGWNGNTRFAYYGDRLAMDLPKTIKWQELQIFPLDERILRKDKKRIFKNNLIVVTGMSDGPVVLNNWIGRLEAYDWVDEIKNQEYKYNSRSQKGEFSFEIIIARN